jgi:hypothetical protein
MSKSKDAEELRAAAALMRERATIPAWHAVASLLGELAEHADNGSQGALVLEGLDIARGFTADSQAPDTGEPFMTTHGGKVIDARRNQP